MIRPAFLSRPELWTRASRDSRSLAEQACAVEHHKRSGHAWHDWALVAFAVTLVLLIALEAL